MPARPAPPALNEEGPKEMEGIINPLVVQDQVRCENCGHEWLAYELDPERPLTCPVCGQHRIRLIPA